MNYSGNFTKAPGDMTHTCRDCGSSRTASWYVTDAKGEVVGKAVRCLACPNFDSGM